MFLNKNLQQNQKVSLYCKVHVRAPEFSCQKQEEIWNKNSAYGVAEKNSQILPSSLQFTLTSVNHILLRQNHTVCCFDHINLLRTMNVEEMSSITDSNKNHS